MMVPDKFHRTLTVMLLAPVSPNQSLHAHCEIILSVILRTSRDSVTLLILSRSPVFFTQPKQCISSDCCWGPRG
eukprot:jgi/Botrbrau1/17083/Bobra.0611s0001.1